MLVVYAAYAAIYMALVLAFMYLYSIFNLRLFLCSIENFKKGIETPRPKRSMVPASPNFICQVLRQATRRQTSKGQYSCVLHLTHTILQLSAGNFSIVYDAYLIQIVKIKLHVVYFTRRTNSSNNTTQGDTIDLRPALSKRVTDLPRDPHAGESCTARKTA